MICRSGAFGSESSSYLLLGTTIVNQVQCCVDALSAENRALWLYSEYSLINSNEDEIRNFIRRDLEEYIPANHIVRRLVFIVIQ